MHSVVRDQFHAHRSLSKTGIEASAGGNSGDSTTKGNRQVREFRRAGYRHSRLRCRNCAVLVGLPATSQHADTGAGWNTVGWFEFNAPTSGAEYRER